MLGKAVSSARPGSDVQLWCASDDLTVWESIQDYTPPPEWDDCDSILRLRAHDTVVLQYRYNDEWKGWGYGNRWDQPGKGIFPLHILLPMLVVPAPSDEPATTTASTETLSTSHRLGPKQLASLIRALTVAAVVGPATAYSGQEQTAQITQLVTFIMTILLGTLIGWFLKPTVRNQETVTIQGTPPIATTTFSAASAAVDSNVPELRCSAELGSAPAGTIVARAAAANDMARGPFDKAAFRAAAARAACAPSVVVSSSVARAAVTRRDVATQSMVTYKRKWAQPRFHVVSASEHGAWHDGMML
jgi:hypothetical protein